MELGYARYPGMRHVRRRPVSVTSDSFPRVVDEKERSCLVSHDSDGADDRGELLRALPPSSGKPAQSDTAARGQLTRHSAAYGAGSLRTFAVAEVASSPRRAVISSLGCEAGRAVAWNSCSSRAGRS